MTQQDIEQRYDCKLRFIGNAIYAKVRGRTAKAVWQCSPELLNDSRMAEWRRDGLLESIAEFLEAEA